MKTSTIAQFNNFNNFFDWARNDIANQDNIFIADVVDDCKLMFFNNELCMGLDDISIGRCMILALSALVGQNNNKIVRFFDTSFEPMVTQRQMYGPKLLNWVGPDDLQEAINVYEQKKAQSIKEIADQEGVKPVGTNQLKVLFLSMIEKTNVEFSNVINFYDPSLEAMEFSNSSPLLFAQYHYGMDGMVLEGVYNFRKCSYHELVESIFMINLINCIIAYQIKFHRGKFPYIYNRFVLGGVSRDGSDVMPKEQMSFTQDCISNLNIVDLNTTLNDLKALYHWTRQLMSLIPYQLDEQSISIVNPIDAVDKVVIRIKEKIKSKFVKKFGVYLALQGLFATYARNKLTFYTSENNFVKEQLQWIREN